MSDDVTAREAVERFNLYDRHLTEGGGGYMETDDQGDWVRYSEYAALLAERDAAYKAGQEEMRERAAATVADMAIAVSNAVAHPDVDAERATALAGIYRERADAIRALPLNSRP